MIPDDAQRSKSLPRVRIPLGFLLLRRTVVGLAGDLLEPRPVTLASQPHSNQSAWVNGFHGFLSRAEVIIALGGAKDLRQGQTRY
jgi:hypothetical protein